MTAQVADTLTVHVVDDDPAVRHALETLLEASGFSPRGYASAEDFLRDFDPAEPGCLLVDLNMESMRGEELIERLHMMHEDVPAVILTGAADIPTTVRMMKAGVVDFLLKPAPTPALIDAIGRALSRDTQRRQRLREQRSMQQQTACLSPRERELLCLLAHGKTSKEIADVLFLAVKTVENHRSHLLDKLGMANVAELVAFAVKAGLG